jgi:predicted alpha/beta hydrolase family esterase
MPKRIAFVNVPTLIMPGIGNSDHVHWQTLWEFANPEFFRVQQRNWNRPVCDEWVDRLEQTVAETRENPVLVAHSLGCLCVAHWAACTSLKIKGALLVAPPNPEEAYFPSEATGFSPVPLGSFGFPSIVVASSNDPYGSLEFARSCAARWGSRFVNIGAAGHINSESGLGEWAEGFGLYQELAV